MNPPQTWLSYYDQWNNIYMIDDNYNDSNDNNDNAPFMAKFPSKSNVSIQWDTFINTF